MSIRTVNPCQAAADPLIQTPRGWSKAQATDKAIQELMVETFRGIVANYHQRLGDRKPRVIDSGPWYANTYAHLLQIRGMDQQLKWLRDNNRFFHGEPPEGFQPIRDPTAQTGFSICAFQVKKEVLPSEALDRALDGKFSFIDCQGAVQLAMYMTLREILSPEVFNTIFSGRGATPLTLHPNIFKTPLFTLGFVREERLPNFTPSPGDNVYFSNIPLYHLKHPNGEDSGYHAVCTNSPDTGEQKYIAFGSSPEGLTEEQMHHWMIAEFNKEPIDPSLILPPRLKRATEESIAGQLAAFQQMSQEPIETVRVSPDEFEECVRRFRSGLNQRGGFQPSGLCTYVQRLVQECLRRFSSIFTGPQEPLKPIGLFPIAKRLNPETIRSHMNTD